MKPHTFLFGLMIAACSWQPADAARPDVRRMTCATAQAVVQQYKSIVLTTGQYTYARIVAGRGYCGPQETTQFISAPTLDHPACRIGYVCKQSVFD